MFELFGICSYFVITAIVFYPMYLGAKEEIDRKVRRNRKR